MKVFIISLFITFASLSSEASHCRAKDTPQNRRSAVAAHYSPHLSAIYITNISTTLLGFTMPTGKEEMQKNQTAYGILTIYSSLQLMALQFISCGATASRFVGKDFYQQENINPDYYNQLKKYFWWSYGLNVAAISYAASISEKEDRWDRVAGVVVAPWLFDLLITRLFYGHKYQSYENPVFIDVKTDEEIKEETVSLHLRFNF